MKYVQVRLIQGTRCMICWVDKHPDLRAGKRITLKGITGMWDVKKVWKVELDAPPDKSWKVGGLL